MMTAKQNSTRFIQEEINWFSTVLDARMESYFQDQDFSILSLPAPTVNATGCFYEEIICRYNMSLAERAALIMGLIPHLQPSVFDRFFIQNKSIGRIFSEFGGIDNSIHRGFIPTGETVSFVIAGRDIAVRKEVAKLFSDHHFFRKENILRLNYNGTPETFWSGKLTISQEYLSYLVKEEKFEPDFDAQFPAFKIHTSLNINDLILSPQVREEVDHIQIWMNHQKELSQNPQLQKRFKRGYRALFYGPPGTGKTLTASLLGATHNRMVYRIDLSQIVSKYIGETEKNLANIFDIAENKDWILFFDEAESLFSKRTDVGDSKDKFANQETSFLLQRIEDFDGLIILATNLKPNIDRAFTRRFQSIINFTMPQVKEREQLWSKALDNLEVAKNINISELARKFEMAGGAINNAVQFAWLQSRTREQRIITGEDLILGATRELGKEGKSSKN
jgi:hypothetical protein